MCNLFWLNDLQWAVIEPLCQKNAPAHAGSMIIGFSPLLWKRVCVRQQ